ncbi:TonB-dependent siderophore receptor [Variovorax sp.]|uniref:TonB-dependent receptor n=1 Tax=Variovorax sp. TaxID=1871043 RepID=UPI002D622CA4|nr:TonB-dependent siderophore receptor [Variovorax sp.]HYP86131.1 TonB-dependent siderophore receptor [Variovorax sp.]
MPQTFLRRPDASRSVLTPIAALARHLVHAGLVLGAAGAAAQGIETAGTLREVVVSGEAEGLPAPYAGGQMARGSSLGILGTTDTMSSPFSSTSFTEQLIQDEQARTIGDVLINDASVRSTTAAGGFSEDIQVRGFTLANGDIGLNGLYGLTSSTSNRVPAEIVERVDVLKGPGTLINGIPPGGSIGGSINVLTKRAGDEPLTRVGLGYLSDSQFGTTVDIGRRFGQDNAWGIRVNGAFRDGEASIDNGNQQVGLGAVALDYRGSRVRWSLDAFTQREDTDNFRPQIGFQPTLTALPEPPDSRMSWFPDTTLKMEDNVVASRLEVDISDHLTAWAGIGYRDGSADQMFPTTSVSMDALGNFTVRNSFYDSYSKSTSADIGLRARFATGSVGHNLSLSASNLDQEQGNAYVTSSGVARSSIYNPAALPLVTAARNDPRKASEAQNYSIAVADTLSFAQDRLLLTVGLRDQTVELNNFSTTTGAQTSTYKESAVSPLAGVVFKATGNISVYGNYTEGLTRGATAPATAANAGEVFAPFKSQQYEAGVKFDWGSFMTTASLFQISRPNSMTDPATNLYSFDGEQRNRGLELAGYGEPVRGLRLMGGLTFNDAKVTRAAQYQGNDAYGVPDANVSLGADWDVPGVQGLALNGRIIYTGSSYASNANTISLPSWTRYDIGARYRTNVGGKGLVLRAGIENLTDENVWLVSGNNYLTVSAPRTFVLSATMDF